jgi:hypothetical protein
MVQRENFLRSKLPSTIELNKGFNSDASSRNDMFSRESITLHLNAIV